MTVSMRKRRRQEPDGQSLDDRLDKAIEVCTKKGEAAIEADRASRRAKYELLAGVYRHVSRLTQRHDEDRVSTRLRSKLAKRGIICNKRSSLYALLLKAALWPAAEDWDEEILLRLRKKVTVYDKALRYMEEKDIDPKDVARTLARRGGISACANSAGKRNETPKSLTWKTVKRNTLDIRTRVRGVKDFGTQQVWFVDVDDNGWVTIHRILDGKPNLLKKVRAELFAAIDEDGETE